MSTLLDVISGALTAIGQLGQGQTPNAEDGALGLRLTNLMLAKFGTKRLFIYNVATRSYTLKASQADYTLGPSGLDYVAARPTFVESCQVNISGTSIWLPIAILDKEKWDAIWNKGAIADIPDKLWPEYSMPNMGLHFNPKPIATPAIKLGCWEPLGSFTSLVAPIPFPDPYEEFLESNLAIVIAPYYDQPVSAALMQRAQEGQMAVMQFNAQSMGGAVGENQKLMSPNVGDPVPSAPAG